MQDVLGLDDEARMNIPGKTGGNWAWQLQKTDFNPEIAAYLKQLSQKNQRTNVSEAFVKGMKE